MKTILLLVCVIALVLVTFILWGEAIDGWVVAQIEANGTHRLLVAGILFSVLALDIFLPVPSSLLSTMCGLYFGVTFGFFISFAAMTVSAIAGYVIGRFFSAKAERFVGKKEMEQLQRIQKKGGSWILLGLRPVPILAEASLVFAGMGRYSIRSTTVQVLSGNAAVSVIYAFVGAFARGNDNSFILAFAGTIIISGVFMLVGRLFGRR